MVVSVVGEAMDDEVNTHHQEVSEQGWALECDCYGFLLIRKRCRFPTKMTTTICLEFYYKYLFKAQQSTVDCWEESVFYHENYQTIWADF